jgi:hypothetical protein
LNVSVDWLIDLKDQQNRCHPLKYNVVERVAKWMTLKPWHTVLFSLTLASTAQTVTQFLLSPISSTFAADNSCPIVTLLSVLVSTTLLLVRTSSYEGQEVP